MRLQVQLRQSQHRETRQRAKRLGVSVAEVIRRCVDAQLRTGEAENPDERVRKALAVAGKYADPRRAASVAADHDAVLARAYRR